MARLYPRINPTVPMAPHTGSLVSPLRLPGRPGFVLGNPITISAADRSLAEAASVVVDPETPPLDEPNAPGAILPFRLAYEGTIHMRIAFNASPKAAVPLAAAPSLDVALVPAIQIPPAGATLSNGLTRRTARSTVPGEIATCLGNYARITLGTLTDTGTGWVLPLTLNFIATAPSGAIDATWFLVLASADDLWPTFSISEVAAETPADTEIPWIHVPPELTLGGPFIPGSPALEAGTVMNVRNFGTGALDIQASTASEGTAPNLDTVSIHATPITISAGGAGDFAIDYTAFDGITGLALAVLSNDTELTSGGYHNATLAVTATASAIGVADTILVLDASGSMALRPDGAGYGDPSGLTPADRRRWDNLFDAAIHMTDGYISFLNDEAMLGSGSSPTSRIGIAVFPNVLDKAQPDWYRKAATLLAPVPVSTLNLRDDIQAKLVLARDGVEGRAMTPIGEGLRVAMGSTAADSGMFHPDRDAHRRWLVLMTDGQQNEGDVLPEQFYQADAVPDFQDKDVRVYSIAYSTATTGAAVSLMQTLADNGLSPVTGGGTDSQFAHAETTINFEKDLTDTFLDAMAVTVGLEPNYDPVGVLTPAAPIVIHEFQVSPFDTGVGLFVDWQARDSGRVRVALISPRCERFDGKDLKNTAGFEFRSLPGYAHAYISQAALLGGEQGHRYGTWKLELRLRQYEGCECAEAVRLRGGRTSEIYKFSVFNRSSLRIEARATGSNHVTGEPIELVTRLTARGVPVRNARVVGTVSAPATDFGTRLATLKIDPDRPPAANVALPNEAIGTWAAKAFVLGDQHGGFTNTSAKYELVFEETDPGVYRASIANTANPGAYSVHVVASGLAGEVPYRRERVITAAVEAVPDPERTLVTYELDEQGQILVRVRPLDASGRAIIFDTINTSRLRIDVQGAKPVSTLTNHFDGTYSQLFKLIDGQTPQIVLEWDGDPVTDPQPVPDLRGLHWMERVERYKPGKLGDDERYKDPAQALGPVKGPKDPFVALGGGCIALGVKHGHKSSRPDHFHASHIVVFTEPTSPATYRLSVRPALSKHWIAVGEGHGSVQSYELPLRTPHIAEVLIEDLDDRSNGGVRLQGVGYSWTPCTPSKPKVPIKGRKVFDRKTALVKKLAKH